MRGRGRVGKKCWGICVFLFGGEEEVAYHAALTEEMESNVRRFSFSFAKLANMLSVLLSSSTLTASRMTWRDVARRS